MAEGRYRLALIGPFGLFAPDGRRIAVTSKKGIAVLATLAVARSGERSRTWLQNQLWGSRDPDQAQASLRRELANLRIAVNNGAEAPPLLTAPSLARLDLDRVSVDVRELEADVRAGRPHAVAGYSDFLEGLDIAGEDAFEDWLRGQRQMVLELVEQARTLLWTRAATSTENAPGGGGIEATRAAQSIVDFAAGADPALPSRPSIAVLPFARLGPEADDDHVAGGITEDVSTALSCFSTLFVVSTGLTRFDAGFDRQRVCRELGVRYLLEGSVRRAGDALRVTVRLVDGIAGEQIWAERFDEDFQNVFALQDRIAGAVAPRIDSSIEKAERARAIAQPITSPDAYQLYWRANALFRRWDRESMLEAIRLVELVLEIEPDNGWAAGLAAFSHAAAWRSRWGSDPDANRAASTAHYDHALRVAGDDPFVLGYAAGSLVSLGGDMAVADRLIARALELHPNASATLFWGGWVDIAIGNPARAISRFESALRFNPRSAVRPFSITGIGVCLLALGRPDDALKVLDEAVEQLSHYPMTLAALCAANSMLGRPEAARRYADRLQAVGGVDSVVSILNDDMQRQLLTSGFTAAIAASRNAGGSDDIAGGARAAAAG